MRRSRLVLAAAAAAGGAWAADRKLDAMMRAFDTNPDPTGGDPLGLPDGTDIDAEAADGARLRGVRCGDPQGATIVMVHGFIESVGFFGPVAHRLAEAGFDVVLVDQRGHGRSARGDAPYTTATLAADLRAWFVGLDLTDVTLVGHSMGGVTAMAFATDEAEVATARTRGLVLVTTLASPVKVRRLPDRDIPAARAMALAERIFALERVGLLSLLDTFGTRPARAALEAARAGFLGTDPTTRADAYDMLNGFDLRPVLGSITIPTLVVAGSHDGLTPLAANEIIAEAIPGARLEVVPGRGHMLAFEAPDALTDLIVQATKPVDA